MSTPRRSCKACVANRPRNDGLATSATERLRRYGLRDLIEGARDGYRLAGADIARSRDLPYRFRVHARSAMAFASAILLVLLGGACRSETALPVRVESLTPPMPGGRGAMLEARAVHGGLEVELIEGLACDGAWKWRATRTSASEVRVVLIDENRSPKRSSCASMVHQRVTVTLAPGRYRVRVVLPTGYASIDRQITVAS